MTFVTKQCIYTIGVCIYIYTHSHINRPYFGPELLDSVPFSMNPLVCFAMNITDSEGIGL